MSAATILPDLLLFTQHIKLFISHKLSAANQNCDVVQPTHSWNDLIMVSEDARP